MTLQNNQTRTKTLVMIPIAAVLLIAAFASPSFGLVGVAEAKKLMVDPKGDSSIMDLDIKSYGFDHKNAYIDVYGTAGGTLASEHDEAIAYVLNIVTRSGEPQIWAVDSHEIQHGDTGTGTAWHAHRVHLTDDLSTPEIDTSCLNEVDHVIHAMVENKRVTFEDMKVKTKKGIVGIEAKEIILAQTVRLHVLVDDPDHPGDAPCIAKVVQVYDTADLGKKQQD